MSDQVVLIEENLNDNDIITTKRETKIINPDHSIATETNIDRTDHSDEDNHTTSRIQTTSLNDLDKKIIRQVEYYFGDTNLLRDRFLQNEINKDDGWIPLSVLITFKRLQALTTDFTDIINALEKSCSGLLEIDKNENKIRRRLDRTLPNSQAELELSLRNRTIYVSGFPKTSDITLDKLLEFFEQYGSTDNIQMQKQHKTKNFNGSVSVVFPSEEKAQEFLKDSKRRPIQYNDSFILESLSSEDLINSGKDLRNYDKQLKKQKKQEEITKQTNDHLQKLTSENLTGALIHLASVPTDATREIIKAKFNPFTKMPWIDFNRGDTEAWIRLNEANTAKYVLEKVLEKGNGKLIIGGQEVVTRVVEGDEEIQFWKDANQKRAAQRTRKNERYACGNRSKRKARNNNRGGKRKLGEDDNDLSNDSNSPKKFKDTSNG